MGLVTCDGRGVRRKLPGRRADRRLLESLGNAGSLTEYRPHMLERQGPAAAEHRVTPLELFFDLVFVFGLTEVTTFLADDPTWHGLCSRAAPARSALVVMGGLCVADEHHRRGRGRPIGGNAGRDGGDVRRGARRPDRVQQPRPPVRSRLPDRQSHAHSALHPGRTRRPRPLDRRRTGGSHEPRRQRR